MFIALMVVYIIILFIEIIPLYKNKKMKDLRVFILLSLVALALNLILMLEIKVPSPATIIKNVVFAIMGK